MNLRRSYDAVVAPGLAAYAGKSAKGTWKLEVQDEERIDTGMIRQFGLELSFSDRGLRSVSKKAAKGRRKRK